MTAAGSSLNAARRARELTELERCGVVDVLVVGGGVTGTGVALDAASRGLSVVLAEKHDLAFGTSRWSSKLVHGGLRYLAAGRIAIAYESAAERAVLMRRTAPHLVRPVPQVVPLLPGVSGPQEAALRAGMHAGDLLRIAARTPRSVLPAPRKVSARQTRSYAPGLLPAAGLRGGVQGWDGQLTDDARLVVALARTAAAHSARLLTRCVASEVTGRGAVLQDTVDGRHLNVDARLVINATGVWAGQTAPGVALRPSRGTHLVLAAETVGSPTAVMMLPVAGERNRFALVLPAPDRRVYVGLTDDEAPGEVPDVPRATETEVDFLLEVLNSGMRTRVGRGDVLGTYSGLRPLLDSGTGRTADLSRRHAVVTSPDGLVTVVGGKLTTYRRMAEDALDAGIAHRGLDAGRCRTRDLPLVGAAEPADLARVDAPGRLVRRYGTEAAEIPDAVDADPGLLEPVSECTEVTGAELAFAVRHEGALDVGDLLDRRTRIGLVPGDREAALPAAERALEAAPSLG